MRSASRTKPRSEPMLGERPFENEPGKILSGETERRSRVLLDDNLCSCVLRSGQNQHIAIQQIKVRPESLFLFRILDRDHAPASFQIKAVSSTSLRTVLSAFYFPRQLPCGAINSIPIA